MTDLIDLRADERLDDMGFGGLQIIQKPGEFCYGTDAVLLADMAARYAGSPEQIADIGAGTGAVSLILSHKFPDAFITEFEVQEGSSDRAKRSIEINELSSRINAVTTDINDIAEEYFGKFDLAVSNPPYFEKGRGLTSSDISRTIARQETTADLEKFIEISSLLLKERGVFAMIHRPFRLAEIICCSAKHELVPGCLRPVFPYPGRDANMILLLFVKGGGREMTIKEPLYVRDSSGEYSPEIELIYERN